MRFRIIAVGERVPAWIEDGIAEYRSRLPRLYKLDVTTVKASPRSQGKPVPTMMEAEAGRLEAAVPDGFVRVALDEHGRSLDTRAFAAAIERWRAQAPGIAFWIGFDDPRAVGADPAARAGEAGAGRTDLPLRIAYRASSLPSRVKFPPLPE